jgi:hypothetical protein
MKRKETVSDGLKAKQAAVLPFFVATRSIEAGCRTAKIAKSTYYAYLQDETFRRELETLRTETINGAIDCLKAGIAGAVEKLLKLLDSKSELVSMRAAHEIITYYVNITSIETIEARLEKLEQKEKA